MGRRSARHDEGAFVVEGPSLVAEAVRSGWEVVAQFLPPGAEAIAGAGEVCELAPGVLERVATTHTPQPVLAEVRVRRAGLPPDATLVLVVDRIADPGNLGTILRSAEAAGVDAVVPTTGTVDAFNPKVVRASAGALFHVLVTDEIEPGALSTLGLTLVGTSSHQGRAYTTADLRRPVALVVGSEAHGVGDDVAVEEWVTIPHAGRAESLNVAMAATLVCFEARRQRGAGFRIDASGP